MSEPVTLPAPEVNLPSPRCTKWERGYQAFRRLLPGLLRTIPGQYVAVHNEEIVGSGPDKLALALEILAKIGNCPIYVGRASEDPEPLFRSGIRRDVSSPGAAT